MITLRYKNETAAEAIWDMTSFAFILFVVNAFLNHDHHSFLGWIVAYLCYVVVLVLVRIVFNLIYLLIKRART